jgi:hypothetical protein
MPDEVNLGFEDSNLEYPGFLHRPGFSGLSEQKAVSQTQIQRDLEARFVQAC